jgi:transcriptional repressor NrdR
LYCPFCGHVRDQGHRFAAGRRGQQIRRRRECLACGERFTTFETAELVMPRVIKSDDTREPFDEASCAAAWSALEKRPVASEAVEAALARVCHKLRTMGEREVASRRIGELVMEELRHLDEVAYVRFASVYRSFQDVEPSARRIENPRACANSARPGPPAQTSCRCCRMSRVSAGRSGLELLRITGHMAACPAARAARGSAYGTAPNPRVGCVVVQGETVVGEGWHRQAGGPHAEALCAAGCRGKSARCNGLCEPRALLSPRPHATLQRMPC